MQREEEEEEEPMDWLSWLLTPNREDDDELPTDWMVHWFEDTTRWVKKCEEKRAEGWIPLILFYLLSGGSVPRPEINN